MTEKNMLTMLLERDPVLIYYDFTLIITVAFWWIDTISSTVIFYLFIFYLKQINACVHLLYR